MTREAYSHEVISAGFWFGDDNVRSTPFYSYTAPEPDGLTEEPLRPAPALAPTGSAHLALLRYEDARPPSPGCQSWTSWRARTRPVPGAPAGTSTASAIRVLPALADPSPARRRRPACA